MSRSPNGFTLLESIGAVLIVGILSTAALGLIAEDLRFARRSASTIEAAALAEDLLFRSEFMRWDSLTSYGEASTGQFAVPLDRYRWHLEIAPVAQDDELVQATATISWPGGGYTVSTRFITHSAPSDSVPHI